MVAVPWWDEHRALCAVSYPGDATSGPQSENDRDGDRARGVGGVQGVGDGCIVVAASDMAIRFHEIWSGKRGGAELVGRGTVGLLGGSDILEGLHGIMREETVIR